MSCGDPLTGWARAKPPVITGRLPTDAITFADLGTPERFVSTLDRVEPWGAKRRQGALRLVHLALRAASDLVLSVLVFDGVGLAVDDQQVGFVVDQYGTWQGAWAGHNTRNASEPAATVAGHSLDRILSPVARSAAIVGRVGHRGMSDLMSDRVRSRCLHLERAFGAPLEVHHEVSRAMGVRSRRDARVIVVQPDSGPEVEFPVPTPCCMLTRSAGEQSCPTCPNHRDDEDRRARTSAWLQTLDDDEFAEAAGRPRR